MMGVDSWKQSGKEEHAAGEAEINAAKAKGHAEGTFDRLAGKKDTLVGAVTGDRGQEASGTFLSTLNEILTLTAVRQSSSRQGTDQTRDQ